MALHYHLIAFKDRVTTSDLFTGYWGHGIYYSHYKSERKVTDAINANGTMKKHSYASISMASISSCCISFPISRLYSAREFVCSIKKANSDVSSPV